MLRSEGVGFLGSWGWEEKGGPAGRERERLMQRSGGKWEPGYVRNFKIYQLSFVLVTQT